jgi:hypothetical protein
LALIDISGQKFGRYTVLKFHSTKNRKSYFTCECECGTIKEVRSDQLKSGTTQSCGCYIKEKLKEERPYRIKHGKKAKETRLYNIWQGMRSRCNSETNPAYPKYGGRGIKVYENWLNDFQNFYDWAMENSYQENLSIERLNNDGNYEPSNCKWATSKEQNNNKSNNVVIEIDGEKKNLIEWSKSTGVHRSTIYRRLKRGLLGRALIEKK